MRIVTSRSIYCCLALTKLEFARFLIAKNKAHVNAFYYVVTPHIPATSPDCKTNCAGFGVRSIANIKHRRALLPNMLTWQPKMSCRRQNYTKNI